MYLFQITIEENRECLNQNLLPKQLEVNSQSYLSWSNQYVSLNSYFLVRGKIFRDIVLFNFSIPMGIEILINSAALTNFMNIFEKIHKD